MKIRRIDSRTICAAKKCECMKKRDAGYLFGVFFFDVFDDHEGT